MHERLYPEQKLYIQKQIWYIAHLNRKIKLLGLDSRPVLYYIIYLYYRKYDYIIYQGFLQARFGGETPPHQKKKKKNQLLPKNIFCLY